MDPRERFAKNLRAARKKRGLTQMELGNLAGIYANEVSRLETADREPRLSTVVKLAHALKMPVAELLRGL
jgi:transcriptional regulator with XRE-family HTH domain